MNSSRLVSIILPCYQHRSLLAQRLDSIAHQTHPFSELIVLDDGSDDGSRELLRELAGRYAFKIADLSTIKSGSPYRQWLKGLSYAEGEYVWIAKMEDTAAPDLLASLVAALEKEPEAAFATAGWEFIGPDGMSLGQTDHRMPLAYSLADLEGGYRVDSVKLLRQMALNHCLLGSISSMLIRTEALRKATSNLTDFQYLGEEFTYLRLLHHGGLLYIDRLLSGQRPHASHPHARRWKSGSHAVLLAETLRLTRHAAQQSGLTIEQRCEAYERIIFHAECEKSIEANIGDENRNIAIYGAGEIGLHVFALLKQLRPNAKVPFFVDAKADTGLVMEVHGIPVIGFNELLVRHNMVDGILIGSSTFYGEILNSMVAAGLHDLIINCP